MNRRQYFVRICSNNRARFNLYISVLPTIPNAGKCKCVLVFHLKVESLARLSHTFPLVKTICKNQASSIFKGFSEASFVVESLCSSVDNRFWYLAPAWNQTPDQLLHLVWRDHSQNRLTWRYVVARNNRVELHTIAQRDSNSVNRSKCVSSAQISDPPWSAVTPAPLWSTRSLQSRYVFTKAVPVSRTPRRFAHRELTRQVFYLPALVASPTMGTTGS